VTVLTLRSTQFGRSVLFAAMLLAGITGSAAAQATDPNPGAITLTTGIDIPSVYYFRGIRQEADPKFTMWPYGDVGIAFFSGKGGLTSAAVNFGVWNSLHTGSTGSAGPSKQLHYEEDFYSTLTLGFTGLNFGVTYTAYTYPNQGAAPVKEVSFKAASTSKYAPYGLIAIETSGQADAGLNKGTYLELGAGPSWPLGGGKATFAVPVKVGMSLKDYYETSGGDNKFGFFDLGGLVTVPLSGIPSTYGSWNVHFGADYLRLGDGAVAIGLGTGGRKNQGVVMGGIGLVY
jgi:hypothetical protein